MSAHYPVPAATPAPDQPEPSFVSLRLWLADSPWRLSGSWLLLAGLLASSGAQILRLPLLPLLLALVLVEAVWGALWSQLVPTHAWPLHQARRRPALPYLQQVSPAARLLGWPAPGPAAAIARAGLPLAALAMLLAWVAGPLALVTTGMALGAVLLAMVAQRAGLTALVAWLQVLVQVALPFGLGVLLAGPWPSGQAGVLLAGLGAGYVLLARTVAPDGRQHDPDRPSTGPLLLGAAGATVVTAVLLVNHQALAAAVTGLLAVAPLLLVVRSAGRAAQPWLLALVLFSALALGTGIG